MSIRVQLNLVHMTGVRSEYATLNSVIYEFIHDKLNYTYRSGLRRTHTVEQDKIVNAADLRLLEVTVFGRPEPTISELDMYYLPVGYITSITCVDKLTGKFSNIT